LLNFKGFQGVAKIMKNKIEVKKLDGINWPVRCPYCGQTLREPDIVSYDLKIRKSLKVLLVGGLGPKRLNVKLCGTCAGKISKFKTVETIGSIILFIAVIAVTYLNKMDDTYKIFLGGFVFWLGVIMMGIAEMATKKLVGVECRLLGENKWRLKFKNDLFFREFAGLNSRYLDRT
jgi:hypothetical protein